MFTRNAEKGVVELTGFPAKRGVDLLKICMQHHTSNALGHTIQFPA